ncbi:MAG: cytochrome c oxidase subunit II [Actinobacteria bacterium]|nr:cytochrome c oxidase subunit II [Actinomycetota bacterium]
MKQAEHQRRPGRRSLPILLILILAIAASGCSTDLPQNSLNPAGPAARQIDDLFWLVFWIATGIFVLVESALIYATFRFRRRRDDDTEVKQVHGNTRLEIVWTIIPALILAAVAVPTVATVFDLRRAPEPSENALVVNVIGHQWWWEFEYPEYGIETANEMTIPAGRTVYLNITSADVIHSFWVPQLNGKRDAVPGRINHLTLTADAPGEFLGQCAEFCGLAHADMRHKVFAVPEDEFEAWVAAQQEPAAVPTEGLAAEGWDTFQVVCTACHNARGATPTVSREVIGAEGGEETVFEVSLAPDLTHFGSRTTIGAGTFTWTEDHLAEWLDDPSSLKPMTPERNDLTTGRILGMPDFDLSEQEIEGLIALLEAWQ